MPKKDNTNLIGKKVKAVPVTPQEIGVDVDDEIASELLEAASNSTIDLNSIESLTNVSQTRESIYSLIDTMTEDDRVSSILETYAEDATQTNDAGQIMWCVSDDSEVSKYVTYLLNVLKVDKNITEWTYSLIKYGDLYLKLFKASDFKDDEEWVTKTGEDRPQTLNEDINLVLHQEDDYYMPYIEQVANPCEMFDLTKHGKTVAFIKAPTNVQSQYLNQELYNYNYYKMNKDSDIDIYSATDFVHGYLANNNANRVVEEVSLFVNKDGDDETSSTFKVKRGQSLLYNKFRTWKQLSLLENSVLLNRLTKSAILTLLNVDIGDMSKTQATTYLARLKEKIEQKSAIKVGKGIQEYTNPGPAENIVYLPTHNGQGNITAQTIGGEYDPKQLTDLEFFQDKFYGSMRVPKQFFNLTGDSTGFNGGTSLTIISSRYGKEIKVIQNTLVQIFTTLINLFLINRGYSSYINRFKLRMQEPVTQEELDRRENMRNKIGVVNDVMQQINGVVEDNTLKLKILKSLLSDCISDPEVINLLQEQIDAQEGNGEDNDKDDEPKETSISDNRGPRPSIDKEFGFGGEPEEPIENENEPEIEIEAPTEGEESFLPSPDQLGISLVDND